MSCKLQNVNTFIFFCWSNHRFSFQFRRWQHLCTLKLKITTTYVHQLASVVNAAGFIEHTQASEIPTVMKEAPLGFWIWAGPDRPHPCLPVTHTLTAGPAPSLSPLLLLAERKVSCCAKDARAAPRISRSRWQPPCVGATRWDDHTLSFTAAPEFPADNLIKGVVTHGFVSRSLASGYVVWILYCFFFAQRGARDVR